MQEDNGMKFFYWAIVFKRIWTFYEWLLIVFQEKKDSVVYVAVYVDDVLLTETDRSEMDQLKTFLHNKFKIKDLEKLHYFLDLDVLYKADCVIISQRKFVLDLLK